MARVNTLSGAIALHPVRFTVAELAAAAETLLREQAGATVQDTIAPSLVEFYVERRLVDPSSNDADGAHFTRRHLLQLMAVQVLRKLDLGLDDIGDLVREVDDKNLKLLVDEPEEAGKKANVMRNWLGVIARGRYSDDNPNHGSANPYREASSFDVTVPPPVINPTRVPLVPRGAGEGRAKRTMLGGIAPQSADHRDLPPDLPGVLDFDQATANAKPRRRAASGGGAIPGRPVSAANRKLRPKMPKRRETAGQGAQATATVWTRHKLAPGIELHVAAEAGSRPLSSDQRDAMLARIRALLDNPS